MISLVFSLVYWERVRMAQRQNDTVVKSTRCVTLAQRHNDTVFLFGTATKRHGTSLWHCVSLWARRVTLAQ